MTSTTATTVTTPSGRVKAFEDALSKFAASHPKTALIVVAVAFNLVGVLFHI